ncbi:MULTISPECIES: small multi-drug export protein [Paenibacillus]|uniref:Small multi-drug export protein n=1 Tax=Paenibacillus baimaensis TaxID=2982185 RepID=A0ABT2UQ69_9BACL|nr:MULTISPECIES: small multi-drug export protein [unclassified Paenibacillus]MCU6796793.1 small multi-drug export protein [Paenibacillus sp. WQ 127069]OMF14960.1 small multi-drug export protein [Paenibacillus sp. FSL H7-0331]
MNHIFSWISVLGSGMFELWLAIPLGFTLQLHPVTTGILSGLGSWLSALIIIFFGSSLREWLIRRFQKNKNGKNSRMGRIWNRYGIIGLGFLSPLLTGSPLGAAIGISFNAEPRKLLLWMGVGIVFWSAVLTTAAAYGLMLIMPE